MFYLRESFLSKVTLGGRGQQILYEGFIKGDIGWEGSADSLWGIHQRWHWVGGVSRFSMRDSSKVTLGGRDQQMLYEGFIKGDIGWEGSGDSLWGIHQRWYWVGSVSRVSMRDSSKVILGGKGQQILYEGFIKGGIGYEGSADSLWGIHQRWYWVGGVSRFSMRDSSMVTLGGVGQQILYEG